LDIEYIIPDNTFLSVYTVGSSKYLDCYDAGEIVIRATQNGNKNYNAAVRVSKTIKVVPTSISGVSSDDIVKVNGNSITLSNANNSSVAIYTTSGALVEKIDSYTGEEIVLDKGVYIVRVGNKTMKVKL
jgi:acetamidase/formamidase